MTAPTIPPTTRTLHLRLIGLADASATTPASDFPVHERSGLIPREALS